MTDWLSTSNSGVICPGHVGEETRELDCLACCCHRYLASQDDGATIFCLDDYQVTGFPSRKKMIPLVLLQLSMLPAMLALL
jgi:hypothetical protein